MLGAVPGSWPIMAADCTLSGVDQVWNFYYYLLFMLLCFQFAQDEFKIYKC